MKIRRFTGTDMRDAMRQVREALGADAVILETVRNATGVEISAAVDASGVETLEAATTYTARGYTPRPAQAADDGPAVRIDQEEDLALVDQQRVATEEPVRGMARRHAGKIGVGHETLTRRCIQPVELCRDGGPVRHRGGRCRTAA